MATTLKSAIQNLLVIILFFVICSNAYAAPLFNKIAVNPNSSFVSKLYTDLLGRSPQMTEVKLFADLINQGTTRTQVAKSVFDSSEFRTALIQSFYKSILGRDVDNSSLIGLLDILNQGASTEDVRAVILASTEYFQVRGNSVKTTFILALYQDLLGRDPSQSELIGLLRMLDSTNGRTTVVGDLLSSTEYRTLLIKQHYHKYLGRDPSSFEINFFIASLADGQTPEDLDIALLGSEEYFQLLGRGFFAGNTFQGILGSFSVSNLDLKTTDFTAIINWGDGQRSLGEVVGSGNGNFSVLGSHKFKKAGNFKINIIIKGQLSVKVTSKLVIMKALDGMRSTAPSAKAVARVAVGDINGDGIADIVTGAGPGGAPYVNLFNGLSGKIIGKFLAFDAAFQGGVWVAVGDVNGDGKADIVTGADAGAAPQVKVFSGLDLSTLSSFNAYDAGFTGGVRVAAGDVNGDGLADIITGSGPGGGPHVKVFDGSSGDTLQSFFAFDTSFTGGVFVAAGDVNGDGDDDIITGAGPGGGLQVKVFDGSSLSEIYSFFAFAPSFKGGVRVAGGDVNGDGKFDVITASGPGGGPHVKVFDGSNLSVLQSFFAFNNNFSGGVFVAAGDVKGIGKASIVSGASINNIGQISIK